MWCFALAPVAHTSGCVSTQLIRGGSVVCVGCVPCCCPQAGAFQQAGAALSSSSIPFLDWLNYQAAYAAATAPAAAAGDGDADGSAAKRRRISEVSGTQVAGSAAAGESCVSLSARSTARHSMASRGLVQDSMPQLFVVWEGRKPTMPSSGCLLMQ